ncbi:MAG: tetratricopeptide repeat protein [Bdellovibrio sp.]|nr:tetratricopeptide repeat protein [Bdellovibrio sp.]
MNLQEKDLLDNAFQANKIGNVKEAEELFQESIILNAKNPKPFFALANIYHRRGEIGKAIKAFSKVLELDPCHTEAAISLSVIYNDIGKYEEAKKIFEAASDRVKTASTTGPVDDVHVNKKFAQRHFELAEQYFTYCKYDDALFEYSKASSLDIENAEIKLKIAKVYAKKGLINKASEELRKLKTERPNYIPARLALGLIYYGSGKIIEAQQEWMKILAIAPDNGEAKTYLSLADNATETLLN